MTGKALRNARLNRGWTEQQAAAALGLSQPYLSLLERGSRRPTKRVVRKALAVYGHKAELLPLAEQANWSTAINADDFARELGALKYPGFSHLRCRLKMNPTELLLRALAQRDLDSRVVEALPWLAETFDLQWGWLLPRAKVNDLQNRLGLVITLARQLAERLHHDERASQLRTVEQQLRRSKLAQPDTLAHESMTTSERRWLQSHRSHESEDWNVLADMSLAHLPYAP
jgi:transcriptional regulator with XRE-family HTH domain